MNQIFLYGPSGSGKSTIGKKLANDLKLPFVDSDQRIEENAGESIPKIMEEQGMVKMRELETETLKQILNGKDCVVALGGGALLQYDNRELVEKNGKVVLLAAEFSTLVDRLQNDSNERPLLAGDLNSKLTSYLDGRAEHYGSFPMKVCVDGKSPELISHEIQKLLGRHHLSAMGEYDVIVGDLFNLTKFSTQNSIIVTDENVARFHLEKVKSILQTSGFESNHVVLSAGEEYKNLETISFLWKTFLDNGLDRTSTVLALGGGVIGDMAGFAASTYMRGINWIVMPTTLLSMVDSSLGGKTGFDLPEGKNLIGSFYSPKLVLADPLFLKTLPEAELISGLAEVVKHSIISDPELFYACQNGLDWIKDHLEEVVKRAMAVKLDVIEEDPYEKGLRASLNLGHTVGHAVELVSHFKLRHGEAVAIGMIAEAKLAERLKVAEKGLSNAIAESLLALRLPIQIPKGMPREKLIQAMRVDKKKNAKTVRIALPAEIGRVELVEVTDLESVLEDI
jgi:shikimate kinase/3-dehydroquinate synthase